MALPYASQTISGYNSSPPSDDGTVSSANEITWAKHKTKLADPVKTLAEAINTELQSAFDNLFGTTFSAQTTTFNVVAGDQGKFFSVTGTSTVNLLAAATAGQFFPLLIANDGAGTVTIDPNGAELINGAATMTLVPGEFAIITCSGTAWRGVKSQYQVIGTDVQAYHARLAEVSGLAPTTDNFVAGNGSNLVMKTPAQARSSIGIDNSSGVINSGDLSVAVGAWIEVSAVSISSAQYATFTGIGSTYDMYKIVFWDVNPNTWPSNLSFQVGTSGGFLTTGYLYDFQDEGGVHYGDATEGPEKIRMVAVAHNNGGAYYSGSITFRSPHTSTPTAFTWEAQQISSIGELFSGKGEGKGDTSSPITQVRVGVEGGTIGSGQARLYGLRT